MKTALIFLVLFLSPASYQQNNDEKNIDTAFQYAKKGIYYALSNIPENKSRLSRELIENDKLFARVKLTKEINGVKIESTGHFSSDEVTIKIYRSFGSLEKEGYIKQKTE